MAEEHEIAKPIDDEFWFAYSRARVTAAIQARIDAAAKLQTLIVWLWGIYTTSATVGIALSKTSYPLFVIILIVLPSPILIAANWSATWAQLPVTIDFKDVVPKTIKESYQRELKAKNSRINKVLILSFVAALFVAVALIGASASKETIPPNFQAYLLTKDNNNVVAVSGHFPADTNIIVRIVSVQKSANTIEAEEFPYITNKSGNLQESITMKSAGNKYDVTIEWTDKGGLTHSLKRTVVSQSDKKE
jgi:hypothetical protein